MFSNSPDFELVNFSGPSKAVMSNALYWLKKFKPLYSYTRKYIRTIRQFQGTSIQNRSTGSAYIPLEAFDTTAPAIAQQLLALFYLLMAARKHEQAATAASFRSEQAAISDASLFSAAQLYQNLLPTLLDKARSEALIAFDAIGVAAALSVQEDLDERIQTQTDLLVKCEIVLASGYHDKNFTQSDLAGLAQELQGSREAQKFLKQKIEDYRNSRDGTSLLQMLVAART